MKIAITSQNFRTITGHAGKTRRFLVFETDEQGNGANEIDRLDLPKELSIHAYSSPSPHPLAAMDILVTAGCGEGFIRRLAAMGVNVIVTGETDPQVAADAIASGTPLPPPSPPDQDK